jgi:O-antigen ligase
MAIEVSWIVRWTFYLFVLSLPFEYPDRDFPIEVTTVTACIFLLGTVWQPRVCYGKMNWACLWFMGFLYAYGLSFFLSDAEYPLEVVKLFLLLLQMLLVFWASFNLLRDERIATVALWILVAACLVRAGLQFAGVDTGVHAANRESALGQNMNISANILTVGLLALIGLTYVRARRALVPRILVWGMAAALGLAIVETGSRGGLLALVTGLLAFTLGGRTARVRVRNALVTVCAMAVLAWISLQSQTMTTRLVQAEEGNLAGREAIFPTAWHMFLEKPLTGWGPAKNKYELGSRLPWQGRPRRDTHNIVLELLTGTGIIGAIPFLIGLGICTRAAWKAREGGERILPFAMVAAVLMGNLSGNYIVAKLLWFVLAYATASRCQWNSYARGYAPVVPRAPPRHRYLTARLRGQGGTA